MVTDASSSVVGAVLQQKVAAGRLGDPGSAQDFRALDSEAAVPAVLHS